MPRSKYMEALKRAKEAERRAAFPAKAVAAGVPAELVADFDPTQTDEEVKKWVESFRDYCASVTAKELAEHRPDRRRGNMLVQHSGLSQAELALSPAAPDWLRSRLAAMAQPAGKRNGSE